MRVLFILMYLITSMVLFDSCVIDKCKNQVCIHGTCIDGDCFCDSGYTGTHCEICNMDTYNCLSGNCIHFGCDGQYASLSSCLNACGSSGGSGYNCISGNCISVSTGAQFSTLSSCQNSCSSGGSAGYNCISGNCNYVSSGAQFATSAACALNCSQSTTSSITFVNTTFTTMNITFNGQTKTANSDGGTAVFYGNSNVSAIGSAYTNGTTSSGTQVGSRLQWNLSYTFPANNNLNVTLNISSDYFFLKIRNSSGRAASPLYVNYGLVSETIDHIVIPADGNTYNIGYYKFFSNSNVRFYEQNNQSRYWNWGPGLPVWSGPPNRLVSLQAI